jgi:uncharacterized protein
VHKLWVSRNRMATTEAMDKMRKRYDEAPIDSSMINKKVRIAGYVVPLDAARNKQREFLLVPYFGACISTSAGVSGYVLNTISVYPWVKPQK